MSILNLHHDIYPYLFDYLNFVDLSQFYGASKAFKEKIFQYIQNSNRKDIKCEGCGIKLFHLYKIIPADRNDSGSQELSFIKIEDTFYCPTCNWKLPICYFCQQKKRRKDLEEHFVCEKFCKKYTCKKTCSSCLRCKRIYDITDLYKVKQGYKSYKYYDILCDLCLTDIDDVEEKRKFIRAIDWEPNLPSYNYEQLRIGCIHSQTFL